MKIGILISGRGSNMVAIVDAVQSGEIPDSEVAVVISDKADAGGLEKARSRGIETIVIDRRGRPREDHDAEIITALKERNVDLVCLAGYMRLLSRSFVQAFPNRIINIHPSLLPAFPGLDAQKQAIEAGMEFSGCTVHYVDEHLDNGPIILQQWVSVEQGDSVSSLSERILAVEHRLYVEALHHIAIEFAAEKRGDPPKYKVLKSFAHNFSHSFVSFTNYMDDGHVIDDIRKTVRERPDHKITIDWLSNGSTPDLTPRIEKSVRAYKSTFIRAVHDAGALLSSIAQFRTDIYLLKNYQIAVDAVLTDDRGHTYAASVTNF
jgi:phosphoribosylglycinamide formyltransferase-1